MNTKRLARMIGLCCLLGAAPALSAAHTERSWYFHAGAGLNLANDVDLSGALGGTRELEPGGRFSAGVGYRVTRNIAVEFDTGWTWNSFNDFDGSVGHLPLMFNGVFTYPLRDTPWEFFAGGGLGGTHSWLAVDDFGLDDADGDLAFAWQVMTGFRYRIQENISLGFAYKYLGTTGGDYNIDGARISLDNSHNHTLGAVFQMDF